MTAWLFDVDGVITNPELKKANPEIIEKLAAFLLKGDIIGLNTGRSLEFIIEEVLKPLEEKSKDKKILKNVFSVGEKGGAWAIFNEGKLIQSFDESLKPPEELEEKVKQIVKEYFSKTTFFYDTKKTMISTELIKGVSLSEYSQDQERFVEFLEKIFNELGTDNFKIEPTLIATDIQNKKAGKDLGVQRFLDLIKGFHEPDEFETFGDSPADMEMFRYLIKNKHKARFIYVGKKEIGNGEMIVKTEAKYDLGTLEYLSNH